MKNYTRKPVPAVQFIKTKHPTTAIIIDEFLNGDGRIVKLGTKPCMSIPVNSLDRVLVFPGEWIVKENGRFRRYSNEEFVEEFTEVPFDFKKYVRENQ